MPHNAANSRSVELPEPVINWLFNVIQPIYQDPRRTFHDAVALLSRFKQLRPRTRVFTNTNGTSELLLCIYGKLEVGPALPILVWLPMSYPVEHPLLFIDLESAAGSRPCTGRYVAADGEIRLPMLDHWRPELSNLPQLIEELTSINFRNELLLSDTDPRAWRPSPADSLPDLPPKPPTVPPRPTAHVSGPPLPVPPHISASAGLAPITPSHTGPPRIPERPPTAASTDLLDCDINVNENTRHVKAIEHLQQSLREIRLSSSLAAEESLEGRKAAIRNTIKQFEMALAYEEATLQRSFEAIEQTKESLSKQIDAMHRQVEQTAAYESRQGDDPDPSTIIATENNIVGQLYRLVAKDCALSDAFNTLNRLLTNEVIRLDIFVKKTRALAREQFLVRLHIQKVIAQLDRQL
ncbi:hypothetical protein HG536_0C02870 [Torulaspora globosa]|uniref:UEV domain-containing protein n=1 Tax=Torulaspora globosa TaxID=48254 RepID=A0A7G3ZF32_9SACH|nr:uncharacterized protein HG536_0C02870 [Torulaspora globosa]QLL32118.1 hypothetical protein HG536_0C02870 [Torulaspora globosa]